MTPSVSSKGTSDASEIGKGVTTPAPSRCTSGCTSEARKRERRSPGTARRRPAGAAPADRAQTRRPTVRRNAGHGNGPAETPGRPANDTEGGKTT